MANEGSTSWSGQAPDNIEIEIDLQVLATRLATDAKFIQAITAKVRKEMTKDVRRLPNLFGPWAGK